MKTKKGFLFYDDFPGGAAEAAGAATPRFTSPLMVRINRVIKAFEDCVLATLGLLLASPMMLVIALGVKLSSPGPVLFLQRRHGRDEDPIVIYKFRTMRVHTECDGQVTQASKNDSRVTRIGAFLRRTSLDELPQLINAAGTHVYCRTPTARRRTHRALSRLVAAYQQRHRVKPGMTGWAQVHGWRGETDTLEKMQRRVEYDLYYIEHWSLRFDLKIIFMTLTKGFLHPNAY